MILKINYSCTDMKTLNLHSEGQTNYLELLKRNFTELIKKIKNDKTLSKEEKQERIKSLKEEHNSKKKDFLKKLF
jgi:lipase chaperone LimK